MGSKWNYIACGVSGIVTLISAFMHSLPLVFLNFAFTILNWYLGNINRANEDAKMVLATVEAIERGKEDANSEL